MKIKTWPVIYVTSMVILLGFHFIPMSYWIQFIIGMAWIILALYKKEKQNFYSIDFKYFLPILLGVIYTPLAMLLTPTNGLGVSYLTRVISQTLQSFIMIFSTVAALSIFKQSAIKYLYYSLCINNIIVIFYGIIHYGFSQLQDFCSRAIRFKMVSYYANNIYVF